MKILTILGAKPQFIKAGSVSFIYDESLRGFNLGDYNYKQTQVISSD